MKFVVEISLDYPEHIDSVQNIVAVLDNMTKGFGKHPPTDSLSEYYKQNPITGEQHVIYESRPQGIEDILIRAFTTNAPMETESTAAYAPEAYSASTDILEFVKEKK